MIANILEKEQIYTRQEYFELEKKALYKSEFRNGKIIPMPNTTVAHNQLSGNMYFHLRLAIQASGGNYTVFNPDQNIFIPKLNQNLYPDTCVVQQPIQTFEGSKRHIINPTLVVEVLSESTAAYDRGNKFRKYQTLPSFQEYVIVDQMQPIIDVLFKTAENQWQLQSYIGLTATIQLNSIQCNLNMNDIYQGVENLNSPQFMLEL